MFARLKYRLLLTSFYKIMHVIMLTKCRHFSRASVPNGKQPIGTCVKILKPLMLPNNKIDQPQCFFCIPAIVRHFTGAISIAIAPIDY